jgi:hypothetical protein
LYLEFKNESVLNGIPDELDVAEILKAVGSIWCPEGQDEMDAYQHAIRGRCMACGKTLEENTVALIGGRGVLGLWHSLECMADMHAISFLREVEEMVVARIEEREDG